MQSERGGIDEAFGHLGAFIARLESAFLDERAQRLGWETKDLEKGKKSDAGTSDSRGAFLFWLLLNLSTTGIVVLAIFFPKVLK